MRRLKHSRTLSNSRDLSLAVRRVGEQAAGCYLLRVWLCERGAGQAGDRRWPRRWRAELTRLRCLLLRPDADASVASPSALCYFLSPLRLCAAAALLQACNATFCMAWAGWMGPLPWPTVADCTRDETTTPLAPGRCWAVTNDARRLRRGRRPHRRPPPPAVPIASALFSLAHAAPGSCPYLLLSRALPDHRLRPPSGSLFRLRLSVVWRHAPHSRA